MKCGGNESCLSVCVADVRVYAERTKVDEERNDYFRFVLRLMWHIIVWTVSNEAYHSHRASVGAHLKEMSCNEWLPINATNGLKWIISLHDQQSHAMHPTNGKLIFCFLVAVLCVVFVPIAILLYEKCKTSFHSPDTRHTRITVTLTMQICWCVWLIDEDWSHSSVWHCRRMFIDVEHQTSSGITINDWMEICEFCTLPRRVWVSQADRIWSIRMKCRRKTLLDSSQRLTLTHKHTLFRVQICSAQLCGAHLTWHWSHSIYFV